MQLCKDFHPHISPNSSNTSKHLPKSCIPSKTQKGQALPQRKQQAQPSIGYPSKCSPSSLSAFETTTYWPPQSTTYFYPKKSPVHGFYDTEFYVCRSFWFLDSFSGPREYLSHNGHFQQFNQHHLFQSETQRRNKKKPMMITSKQTPKTQTKTTNFPTMPRL